jgi:hypothetical protein
LSIKAAILPLFLLVVLGVGSLCSCSENPPTGGKDSCDTCNIPCDTCDTTKPNLDSLSHAFTWTEYSIPGVSSITGVAVFSDNRIYAYGNDLYIFDGIKWTTTKAYVGSGPRTAGFIDMNVFSFSESNYWAVSGSIVYNGDGKFVEEYRNLGPYIDGSLRACWGTSKNDMFFVGDYGAVTHFDGTTFTKMPRVTTKNLRSVWGTGHNDVWACGFNSSTAETVLIHYDSTSWKEDEISQTKGIYATGGFNTVWAVDSAGHKFATTSGALLIRKTDNTSWRSDSGLVPNSLGGGEFIGISPRGNTANDFMVVGGWGFVAHWNGKTWHKYDELYDYSNPSYGTSAFSMKGNTACVVGVKNGTSWIAIGRRKP